MRLLNDWLRVEKVEPEKDRKTEGGILLPDQAKKNPTEYKVTEVGENQFMTDEGFIVERKCNVDDIVLLDPYSVHTLHLNDNSEVHLVKDRAVIAILS